MTKNILLCGVGGQGTVLASKLIAAAAMAKGSNVMSAETIGMAQKGGSVVSHLRMGAALHSPMLAPRSADLIIGFEPAEAVRALPYLREGGCVIVNSRAITPVSAALSQTAYDDRAMLEYLRRNAREVIIVDGARACQEAGSAKTVNMVMLGVAARSGKLGFTIAELREAMRKLVRPQFYEINNLALNIAERMEIS